MGGGYTGKILWVDLDAGTVKEENVAEEVYQNFLAGYGLAVKFGLERQKGNVDPLGGDNILGITAGILTGTPALFSGWRRLKPCTEPMSGFPWRRSGWG